MVYAGYDAVRQLAAVVRVKTPPLAATAEGGAGYDPGAWRLAA